MRRSGQSLLEGMVAALLLAIGVTTVMQAIILSSQQNAGAAKLSEAAALANQVVGSIQERSVTGLTAANNVFNSSNCKSDNSLDAFTGGVTPVSGNYSACVTDLDLFDLGAAPGRYASNAGAVYPEEIVPGYDGARSQIYRRMVVLFSDSTTGIRIREGAVVVSFTEFGQRRFVTRMFSLTPTTKPLPQL